LRVQKHRPERVGKSDFQKVKTAHLRAFVPEDLQSAERQDVLRAASANEAGRAARKRTENNPQTDRNRHKRISIVRKAGKFGVFGMLPFYFRIFCCYFVARNKMSNKSNKNQQREHGEI
jgi:hypothetical protein